VSAGLSNSSGEHGFGRKWVPIGRLVLPIDARAAWGGSRLTTANRITPGLARTAIGMKLASNARFVAYPMTSDGNPLALSDQRGSTLPGVMRTLCLYNDSELWRKIVGA
jgi:hypothetical protein